jgi:hypothetical protein
MSPSYRSGRGGVGNTTCFSEDHNSGLIVSRDHSGIQWVGGPPGESTRMGRHAALGHNSAARLPAPTFSWLPLLLQYQCERRTWCGAPVVGLLHHQCRCADRSCRMKMHLRLQAARQQLYGTDQRQHMGSRRGQLQKQQGDAEDSCLLLTGLLSLIMLLLSQEPEHGHQLSLQINISETGSCGTAQGLLMHSCYEPS